MKKSSPLRLNLWRHPSAFLLLAQLLSLALYAAFNGSQGMRALVGLAGLLVLVLAVWVVVRSPGSNQVAWALAALAALLSLLAWLLSNPILLIWAALPEAALYFYAASSLIARMMEDTRVTADELYAAGATWTLLAWGFGYLYLVCQAWVPGSFLGAGAPELTLTFLELLFLSFTNLSATGLGDILPISAPARVLAMVEQFAGVAYLTVVVSRLVGMTLFSSKKA